MSRLIIRSLGIASSVFAVDQATKLLARANLPLCTGSGCEYIDLSGPLSLVRVANEGGAFGFSDRLWLWALLTVLGVLLIPLYPRFGRATRILVVGAGLQLGGVLGNVVDRLAVGSVTDFMHLGVGPIINVADIALALGAVLVAIALIRRPLWRPKPTDSTIALGESPWQPLTTIGGPRWPWTAIR